MGGPAPNGLAPMQQQPPPGQQQQQPPQQQPAQPKPDWTEHKAPDGRLYWYNAKTKTSKWDKPLELLTPEVGSRRSAAFDGGFTTPKTYATSTFCCGMTGCRPGFALVPAAQS